MTIKRKRIYEVIIFSLVIILTSLCAYMGITAVQKSMKLNMSFQVTPSMLVSIAIYDETTGQYEVVFQNSGTTTIKSGVVLSGNTLTFSNNYEDALGTNFKMKITNNNAFVMMSEFSGASVLNGEQSITSIGVANGQTSPELIVNSVDNFVIEFSEPQQMAITYKDQGNAAMTGTQTIGSPTTHTYGTATPLKHAYKQGAIFAGWYTSSDCTGNPVETLGATAYSSDITLYAKWATSTNEINGLTFNMYSSGEVFQTGASGAYYMFKTMAGTYSSVDVEWIVLGGSLEDNYKGGSADGDYVPNETLFLSTNYGTEWYATTTGFYINGEETKNILLFSRYILGDCCFNDARGSGQYSTGSTSDLQGKMANMATTLSFGDNLIKNIKITPIERTTWSDSSHGSTLGGVESLNLTFFPLGGDSAYETDTSIDSFNISKYFGSLISEGEDIARIAYSITSKTSTSSWWLRSGLRGVDSPLGINNKGSEVTLNGIANFGIRPAFVFNLN